MVSKDWTKVKPIGDSFMIRIPARVFKDEAFPFKLGEDLIVGIQKKSLVITKEE